MPKKNMTAEERKAFGEKMKAAREKKKAMQQNPAPVPASPTAESQELPQIPKDDDVKESLKLLLDEVKSLKKDRDILMQTADKRALAHYYARNKKDLPPIVSLRSINGKLIVKWRMVEDKGSFQVPGTGKWTEYQLMEVTYEDGSTEQMTELEWNRRYDLLVKAKVVGVTTDTVTQQEILKLARLDNGNKLEIGVQFIN